MSNDALERLKKRIKPRVESREAALSPPKTAQGLPESPPLVVKESGRVETERAKARESQKTSQEQELTLETKQSTFRLEKSLAARLNQECQHQGISREVLIEALFVHYEQNSSVQRKIWKEAQKRQQQRTEIANYRRAKSMMKNFGSPSSRGD